MYHEHSPSQHFDAIIVGGGPGGAATASALARRGRRTLVLEREHFPRYHVGESLIPNLYRILRHLGALEKVKQAGFQLKPGFQFISSTGKLTPPYYFAQNNGDNGDSGDPDAITWQVDRARFDTLLLEHARDMGATVEYGAKVVDVLRDGERVHGVRYVDDGGQTREVRASFVADCSGRAGFLARRLQLRQRDPVLDQLAIWRYIRGEHRQPGRDEGNIVIALLAPSGWFWWIPLADGKTSVGVVASARHLRAQGQTLEECFYQCLESNPRLKEWTAAGEWVGDFRSTGDYSYSARQMAGDGWVLVGDAGAFIDPVFSSGIWMAMTSGVLAAEAMDRSLQLGDTSAAGFRDYEALFHRGEQTLRMFLDTFYDENFSAGQFFRRHPEWIGEWGRVLQGDVFDDNGAFIEFLLDYRRKCAAERGGEAQIYLPKDWELVRDRARAQMPPCPPLLRFRDSHAPAQPSEDPIRATG